MKKLLFFLIIFIAIFSLLITTGYASPITIQSPAKYMIYYKIKVPLTFMVDEPTSQIGYSLDNKPNITITENTNLENLANGTHEITIFANDVSGVESSEKIKFYYCLGDVNRDGRVSVKDVNIVGAHYGSRCESDKYDSKVDLNDDCKIDIGDISIVSRNYGNECLKMKGVVVIAPDVTVSKLPYSTALWNTHHEKILDSVPQASVALNSPRYGYVILDIPPEAYNETNETLTNMGYFVREEKIYKLALDESVSAIKGPYVWADSLGGSYTLTGAGKIITILDTGLNCSHPDFNDCNPDNSGKLLSWYDSWGSATPEDGDGHGTHVAGIATGTGAGDARYKGVAPDASLRIGRVCWGGCPERTLVEGLKWATNITLPTNVISLSLGWPEDADACQGNKPLGVVEREIYDEIQDAIGRNIVVVAAAGNEGIWNESIIFPACIDEVIAVGMTFKRDYVNYDRFLDLEDMNSRTSIHVIVNISGGYNDNYEYEWIADGKETGMGGTGFVRSFYTTGATTVRVRIEGKWKDGVYALCFGERSGWAPGGDEKGDDYWEWTENFPAYSRVVIEVGARPHHEAWGPLLTCWYTDWNPYEERIRVNIFSSNKGLKDRVLFWSGRGPSPQGTQKPDVVAPGYRICAARAGNTGGTENLICGNDQYIAKEGTSMATPHVAGLVALVREAESIAWTPGRFVTDALKKGDETGNTVFLQGHGRINVKKAVDFITDCSIKPSVDDYNHPATKGYCKDYTHWSGDSCAYYQLLDECSGNNVKEAVALGNTCIYQTINCTEEYDSSYYCSDGKCTTSGNGEGGGGKGPPGVPMPV